MAFASFGVKRMRARPRVGMREKPLTLHAARADLSRERER